SNPGWVSGRAIAPDAARRKGAGRPMIRRDELTATHLWQGAVRGTIAPALIRAHRGWRAGWTASGLVQPTPNPISPVIPAPCACGRRRTTIGAATLACLPLC